MQFLVEYIYLSDGLLLRVSVPAFATAALDSQGDLK
jgi:hypothetical protein